MTGSGDNPLVTEARYRPVLAVRGWSTTLNAIWRDAYGDDYPEDVEPLGFSTLSELELMRRWLGVGPGESIVDLGCGRGGLGLWLARATGASLVGIDIVPEATEEAARKAQAFGPAVSARFQVGDFRHTGLPGSVFAGAVSVDSVWMVLDKVAAIREVQRLLVPGAAGYSAPGSQPICRTRASWRRAAGRCSPAMSLHSGTSGSSPFTRRSFAPGTS